MSNEGFVYVLINPSMPDLAKVGKTQQDPKERAKELSQNTGVATPFQVAYKTHFADISEAESFVHTILEKEGYRLSDNREFFNADLTDVINAVISAKEHFENVGENDSSDTAQEKNTDLKTENEADKLFQKANAYYEGDGVIQDFGEALKLFKQASKLGSPEAFQLLGSIYANGNGVQKNFQKALTYYKKGGQKGNFLCYHELAMEFMIRHYDQKENEPEKAEKQIEQAKKSWELFFKEALKNLDKTFYTGSFADHAAIYVSTQLQHGYEIKNYEALRRKKDEIIYVLDAISQMDQKNIWNRSIKWLQTNL